MLIRPAVRLLRRAILIAALLSFFALALGAALAKSPTNDEPVHLTRGAALAQSGDLSLQFEHPPLAHRLIGGLLRLEPTAPPVATLDSRAAGDRPAIAREFLWEKGLNVERALLLGRLPVIWLGVLLGAAVALWTSAAARSTAALAVAMALYASSPNLLAAAALATTDLPATAAYFGAVCAWWFHCRRPGRGRWAATGVLLGLALAAKLTGILLIPVLILLACVYPHPHRHWPAALGLLPVAAIVVWAVYGFQIGLWRGVTVPAPAYWASWESVLTHVTGGHQAFFLGRRSAAGWWSYFPVTFLLKSSLPFLALLAAALLYVVRHRVTWRVAAFALLPVAALFAAAIASRLNIGYRHILPIEPFLLVIIGLAVPAFWTRRAGRWAVGAAVAWAAAAAIWIHPHHLAYFNELVGGPAQGFRYLGDSNLDWGQDLKGLADYAATGDELDISYGGASDPAYYGLTRAPLAGPDGSGAADFRPANPAPGRYAISAGHIQGLLPEADLFDWFRRRAPDGSIGYSILLYDVAAAQPGDWVAQCLAPGPLLTPAAAQRLVGPVSRHLTFDCQTAWVFPDNGAPGWYILPMGDATAWLASGLDAERPLEVYHHGANEFDPAYVVYYWPGTADPAALLGHAPAEPLLAGPAALHDYSVAGNEWLTLWRVEAATAAPLSIQAHLYANEESLQVADGLGFSTDQWQPGDWFIQRHVFPAPGAALETGLYNYATLQPVSGPIRLMED